MKNKWIYWCGLTSLSLPKSLASIGERAFRDCCLTSITLLANVIVDSEETSMGLYGAAFKSFYERTEEGGNKSSGGTFVYNTNTQQWSKSS